MKGISSLIAASVLLGIIPSVNKLVLTSDMSPESTVFFTYLTMSAVTFLIIKLKHIRLAVNIHQLISLAMMGLFGLGITGYLLNIAYGLVPVGIVTMIHFLYPTVVSAIMAIFFRQKFSAYKWIACVLSLVGLGAISNIGGNINLTGVLIAVVSSFTYSFYMIANEKFDCNLSLTVKLFYTSLTSSVLFGIITAVSHTFTIPTNAETALLLFGGVGLGSLVAFYLVTLGISKAGATTSSFICTLEPVTSLVMSVIFYNQRLTVKIIAGCVFIILSVIFNCMKKQNKISTSNS